MEGKRPAPLPFPPLYGMKTFAGVYPGCGRGQREPPAQTGGWGAVYCLGSWPRARPADKGRAVTGSGRRALLGIGGRMAKARGPSRDAPLSADGGPGARHRRPPRPSPQSRPREGLSGPGSPARRPSRAHPHPRRQERKERGWRERPPLRRAGVRAPPAAGAGEGGGRGAGASRGCGGGGVCGPVFGQHSTLGEKNICLKV